MSLTTSLPDGDLAFLGLGEREAIQLAEEQRADLLLMEERKGRLEAKAWIADDRDGCAGLQAFYNAFAAFAEFVFEFVVRGCDTKGFYEEVPNMADTRAFQPRQLELPQGTSLHRVAYSRDLGPLSFEPCHSA